MELKSATLYCRSGGEEYYYLDRILSNDNCVFLVFEFTESSWDAKSITFSIEVIPNPGTGDLYEIADDKADLILQELKEKIEVCSAILDSLVLSCDLEQESK